MSFNIFTAHNGARVSSPDLPRQKTTDLILLGVSFAWGHGLKYSQTFLALLSQSLQIATTNLAFGSYGTVQALQLLQRNNHLKPKLVVYAFIDDHLRRNLSPCASSLAPYCLPVAYVGVSDSLVPELTLPDMRFFSAEFDQSFFKSLSDKSFGFKDIWWQVKGDFLVFVTEDRWPTLLLHKTSKLHFNFLL